MSEAWKRSVKIAGHRTSLSLEPQFWDALKQAAQERGLSVSALVAEIDDRRGTVNLSSAVRIYVLGEARRGRLRSETQA
ncbi:MAG TPA: ribbon-helix-helix domain-containing protein [Aestuariivirgaceae bacterium]|jgi:predicted DNA-binding ribbon-helix-helix protein